MSAPAGGPVLVTVAGPDRVGASSTLFAAIAGAGGQLRDVEQVTIQGQLVLTCLVAGVERATLLAAVQDAVSPLQLRASATPYDGASLHAEGHRLHVTVLASTLGAGQLADLASTVAGTGANIDRIGQLGREPLAAYELVISGVESSALAGPLTAKAAELGIDIALQDDDIHRRAKRLIVLDVEGFPVVRQWFVVRRTEKRLLPAAQALWNHLVTAGASFLPETPARAARGTA